MSDPLETLKMVIKIFEEADSNKDGLFDAQDLIFERHPKLEGFEND